MPGDRPCALCGVPLQEKAHELLDEFVWVDAAGSFVGRDTDLLPVGNPYERLNALVDRSRDARGRVRAMPLQDAQEYATLLTRMDVNGAHHAHYVTAALLPCYRGDVPRCCDRPAWLRPSGWHCRVCRAVLQSPTAAAA